MLDDQKLGITLSLSSGTGQLLGTTTVAAVAGIATFTDLAIDKVGADKILTATSGVFTAKSAVFAITPGAASQLTVQQAPAQQGIGARVTPAPIVALSDAYGNATAASALVTVSAAPATTNVSGTTSVSAVNGAATFDHLFIGGSGTQTTLTFASPGTASATALITLTEPDLDWPVWRMPGTVCRFCTDGAKQVACSDPSALAGQDGLSPQIAPAYDTSAAYLLDDVTGLIWEKDATAYSHTDGVTYAQAVTYCSGLTTGGLSWRLPTRIELATLVDFANLPDGAMRKPFWSQTPDPQSAAGSYVWVDYDNGTVELNQTDSSNAAYLRCTAGAASTYVAPDPALAPHDQYATTAHTVTDQRTLLVWQRAEAPTTYAWPDALAYCNALTIDGVVGWRLPSAKELLTIVNDREGKPAGGIPIDSGAFADATADTYWTATPLKPACAPGPTHLPSVCSSDAIPANCAVSSAWWVSFYEGRTDFAALTTARHARCVH